jgi:hypothetical protein
MLLRLTVQALKVLTGVGSGRPRAPRRSECCELIVPMATTLLWNIATAVPSNKTPVRIPADMAKHSVGPRQAIVCTIRQAAGHGLSR